MLPVRRGRDPLRRPALDPLADAVDPADAQDLVDELLPGHARQARRLRARARPTSRGAVAWCAASQSRSSCRRLEPADVVGRQVGHAIRLPSGRGAGRSLDSPRDPRRAHPAHPPAHRRGRAPDAQPSLTALQTWLQLSDDLLATAWGTMDRYHLAVADGRQAEGHRPRPRDDRRTRRRRTSARSRSQKTAALRMSLDAVERQGMPFRGETGGVGAGQGMGEVPAADGDRRRGAARTPTSPRRPAALDPARSRDAAPARRGAARRRRARRPRADGAPPGAAQRRGSSGDGAPASRPSAAPATSRRPTTSPATTSSSASASTSTCPGPSTATSGPPRSRPGRHGAAPAARAARRGRARRSASRLPARSRSRDRRHWLDLQLVALETLARVQGRRADPVPRPGRALPRPPPRAARPDATFERAAARARRAAPGHGSLADRLEAEDAAWTRAARAGPGRRRRARAAVPGARGALSTCRPARVAARLARPRPAVVRLQLVRRRLSLAGRLQPRPPDPPPEARRPPWPTRRTPGHHLEHARKERRWSRSSGASSRRSC